MSGCAHSRIRGIAFIVVLGILPGLATPTPAGEVEPVRIGVVETLFQDIPRPLVIASMIPFKALMEAQTGTRGDMLPIDNAGKLAEQLDSAKLQFGVMHGIEFAWARQKHPELRALAIAINQQRDLYAHLVVHKKCQAAGFADLQGQTLAEAEASRIWCRLFIEQRCRAAGKERATHFRAIHAPATVEDALDDVVEGKVSAAVVDGVSLESYQRRKPTRFANLKELQRSEKFPAVVVAYRGDGLDEATLQRFRSGLVDASKSIAGRQVLTIWRMTAFEPVPADYDVTLRDIVKVYPPPRPIGAIGPGLTQAKSAP